MIGSMIEFSIRGASSRQAPAYLALPAGGQGPGVLVLHAWWGLNDTFKALCDRLAQAGFVALAPDLYSGRLATAIPEAKALMGTLDFDQTQESVGSALTALRAHPAVTGKRVGATGFSMGGSWALLLGGVLFPAELSAVITFYGLEPGIEWDDYRKSAAAFQGHFADRDEFESLDTMREVEGQIREAGRPVEFYLYPNTQHWFFEANRPEYDPEAADLAWERTLAFLGRYLR